MQRDKPKGEANGEIEPNVPITAASYPERLRAVARPRGERRRNSAKVAEVAIVVASAGRQGSDSTDVAGPADGLAAQVKAPS